MNEVKEQTKFEQPSRPVAYLLLIFVTLLAPACFTLKTAARPKMTSHQNLHYVSELGFSYGRNYENGLCTGNTNGLLFTVERLRRVVDEVSGIAYCASLDNREWKTD